jgi:hypothetical protein
MSCAAETANPARLVFVAFFLRLSSLRGARDSSVAGSRMDCRVKPGNDDMKVRSRGALMRPSFAHHHDAISKK